MVFSSRIYSNDTPEWIHKRTTIRPPQQPSTAPDTSISRSASPLRSDGTRPIALLHPLLRRTQQTHTTHKLPSLPNSTNRTHLLISYCKTYWPNTNNNTHTTQLNLYIRMNILPVIYLIRQYPNILFISYLPRTSSYKYNPHVYYSCTITNWCKQGAVPTLCKYTTLWFYGSYSYCDDDYVNKPSAIELQHILCHFYM